MSTTSNPNESTSTTNTSGGLLDMVKSAASSVLGLGDKESLSKPVDMNEASKSDTTSSEKGSLKDKILSKADELFEHNPDVEKTDKVNVQSDKGLETHSKGRLTKDTKEVIHDKPEDLDELNKGNEVESSKSGITGKVIGLATSAVNTAENIATFVSEKTLGHERTETIKAKANDLLETVESKLGLHDEKFKDKMEDAKVKGSKVLQEGKKAAKQVVQDVKETASELKEELVETIEIPPVSSETHKKLSPSATRRLKARKARLAKKLHEVEEKGKDVLEEGKQKAHKELREMKQNFSGKGKSDMHDEKLDSKSSSSINA